MVGIHDEWPMTAHDGKSHVHVSPSHVLVAPCPLEPRPMARAGRKSCIGLQQSGFRSSWASKAHAIARRADRRLRGACGGNYPRGPRNELFIPSLWVGGTVLLVQVNADSCREETFFALIQNCPRLQKRRPIQQSNGAPLAPTETRSKKRESAACPT
jgi:hypothetical protein